MVHDPDEAQAGRYPDAVLRDTVGRLLAACGMSGSDAGMLADALVHAELRGNHAHGLLRIPDCVARLTRGQIDPGGRPQVVSDIGGALVIDSGNAMGEIAGRMAIDRAIGRAHRINVAVASVRGSDCCGALDWYTLRAAEHGMIGIAGTAAAPAMAAWGGRQRAVGLNPLSIAVPASDRPLVLDMALGATTHGRLRLHARKGQPVPEGWAFDAEGRPTTDAAAALDGLIRPIGGHKGIGLAMMIGILASVLSGSDAGPGGRTGDAAAGIGGQFYMVVNIAGFRSLQAFKAHVDRLADGYRTSRRAEGVERVYLPGELEAETEARNRRDGVPLDAETLALIVAAAAQLGVEVPTLNHRGG